MGKGIMEVGHVFTIEPPVCEGTSKAIEWKDNWTMTTRDGKRSVQFEHTLLIQPDGVEAFTARLPDSNKFWWESHHHQNHTNTEAAEVTPSEKYAVQQQKEL